MENLMYYYIGFGELTDIIMLELENNCVQPTTNHVFKTMLCQ